MRLLSIIAVLLLVAGCSTEEPAKAQFTKVTVPGVPARLAAQGDQLVVATRVAGKPAMVRYRAGKVTEVALTPTTGYGAEALWYSLSADADQLLAIGGKTGGAHGNVRWSVWRTTPDGGLAEQPQPFSTFGGLGGGALIDGVLPTKGGPLLVGTWQSHSAGADVMLWATDGTYWNRQDVAGTPLESTSASLKFPESAAAHGADVVIAGWVVDKGRQRPVVWTLRDGVATLAPLPDGGRNGTAITVSCADTCSIAGRVDGKLALWRQDGNSWRRRSDVPVVTVGDRDRPVPPVGDTLVYSDRGNVHVATLGGDDRAAAGPTGVVTAVTRVGDTTYVLAGPDDDKQTLWRADPG
ncbi:hypothetical protein [Actinophytocola oryzae]|uniref:Uncharacterized protein n=1 Tax=Actinophytocola oryzae TaxID=502181 RepID=A0A4R7VV90_9PSEU|nr:hypothetical protein [Actinophytocola oryzae]TDV53920.1 hypothetical protein CLV71_104388 [Actinophytocola oryzae]